MIEILSSTKLARARDTAALVAQIGEDEDVNALVDEVLVMEQGTQKVVDDPGYAKAEASLGGKRGWAILDGNVQNTKKMTIAIGEADARDATIKGKAIRLAATLDQFKVK